MNDREFIRGNAKRWFGVATQVDPPLQEKGDG
jgi:hypothetical protein